LFTLLHLLRYCIAASMEDLTESLSEMVLRSGREISHPSARQDSSSPLSQCTGAEAKPSPPDYNDELQERSVPASATPLYPQPNAPLCEGGSFSGDIRATLLEMRRQMEDRERDRAACEAAYRKEIEAMQQRCAEQECERAALEMQFDRKVSDLNRRCQDSEDEAAKCRARLVQHRDTYERALDKARTFSSDPVRSNDAFIRPHQSALHQPKISDAVIAPRPFNGINTDKAEDWLKYFIKFANFKGLTERDRIDIFAMLLQDGAADWFNTLSESQTRSWDAVEREFRAMYSKPDVLKYQEASALWLNPQKSDERVDLFITRLKKEASRLNMPDNMLHYAVLNGLRPAIRSHCLQQGTRTLDETLKAARIAEASQASDPLTSLLMETIKVTSQAAQKQAADIAQLTKQVASLNDKPEALAQPVNTVGPTDQQSGRGPPGRGPYRQGQGHNDGHPQGRPQQPRPQQQQRMLYSQRAQQQQQAPTSNSNSAAARASGGTCFRCGRDDCRGRDSCYARDQVCRNCRKIGHFARVCRSTGRRE
jgi:hypothetical protein